MKYKHKPSCTEVVLKDYHYEVITGSWKGLLPRVIVESGNDWERIEEPLLVTEDRVDIFDKKQDLYAINITNWIVCTTMIAAWAIPDGGREVGWRFFSTKEARLQYMVENKAVLTLAEIKSRLVEYGMDKGHSTVAIRAKLTEVTREKLKANDSNL